MARNYARITTTIWRDPSWRALSHDAQWAYLAILSQPKLSLAGCIDTKFSSWDGWAADDTALLSWLRELEEHHFVLMDADTDELVVRTFVQHDDVLKNRNLGRGMWSAWQMIESEKLRLFVVENLPDEAWEPRFEPPFPSRRNHGLDHGSNHESNLLTLNHNPSRNLQPPESEPQFVRNSHQGPVAARPS